MSDAAPGMVDRREQLLAAAREVLAEKGLDGARVSEIVKRAGVSQGTFYLYFTSKLSLVAEFHREMQKDIQSAVFKAVNETGDTGEAIEAAVKAALEVLERYRDILGVVLSGLGFQGGVHERREAERPYHQMVIKLIERGQELGDVDRNLDPEMTARIIVGLIERAGADCFVYNPDIPPEPFVAEVARFIRNALGVG